MIDPTVVSTIRVGELPSAPFNLTDNIPHEVGVDLKKGTIEELSTFISAYIGATDAVGFRAISVTDGQTLPTTTKEEFILVGKGTFYNVAGGSTIVCTEELNAIVSNGSFWFIGVEIPVNIELSGVTQFIRQGFTDTTPSEDVVYDALALKVPYTGATTNVNLGEFQLSAGQITFDQTPTQTAGVGVMRWNDTDGTLDLGLKGGNVTLQLGQEQIVRVVNKTGGNLTEAGYQAVYTSGAQGQRLKVDLALANSDLTSAGTLGLITENILVNQEGFVTTNGLVRGINTTGSLQSETWADGDILYLSPITAGKLTNIKPTAPQHSVTIGVCVYAHITQGAIFVKVDNGYELEELHNVLINTAINNDALIYESSTGLWKNKTISSALGYTPENIANKSDSYTVSSSTTYASTKALVDGLATKQNTITNAITGTGTSDFISKWDSTSSQSSTGLLESTPLAGISGKNYSVSNSANLSRDARFYTYTFTELNSNGAHSLGAYDEITRNIAGSGAEGYASYDSYTISKSQYNYDHFRAFQARNQVENTAGINRVQGFSSLINHIGTGVIGNVHNYIAESPTGSGTINNLYGLYVQNMTRGTNNWAIWTDTGKVRFGDNVNISTPTVSSLVNSNIQLTRSDGSTIAGVKLESLRNAGTGGIGLDIFVTTNNAAEVSGTYTSAMKILNTGNIVANFPIRLKGYTVATLPAGTIGDMAYVTDALAPTYNGVLTGGGAVKIPVFYNGTAWTAH